MTCGWQAGDGSGSNGGTGDREFRLAREVDGAAVENPVVVRVKFSLN
ncbi:MAG: hypothetical protein P8J87_10495 [Verrucomicrobiales bacterium]|nr:hypothetical protein [Verrucomicrobiales bacterium]